MMLSFLFLGYFFTLIVVIGYEVCLRKNDVLNFELN